MIRKLIFTLCLLTFACAPVPMTTASPTSSGIDSELEAAIEAAQDSLDDFIAKITTPHPDRTLIAVKVRFTAPGEAPQDIWVDQVTYTDGVLRGSMGDDIPLLRLEVGETIKIEEEDIVDWAIVENGKLLGGYTIRLAVQRMSPEEKERFLETLPYTIED
jgi:uncharacterized protein YegJ (DUF2314 family)